MSNKIQKLSAIIALLLVLVLLAPTVISSLPGITVANAWTSSGGYTGKEDPEDVGDFDNSMEAMYKYRAWCVFKGLGMDDNQACAALACMQAESHYRPELNEGGDLLGLGALGDSPTAAAAYIENYCQKMDTNPDFRTQCTDEIMRAYNIAEDTIAKCHNGDFSGNSYSSVVGENLSLRTYYSEEGIGWLGLGLYQFTGRGNFGGLCDWADTFGDRWFNFEIQLSYFLADAEIGGYPGPQNADITEWVSQTKGKSLDECTESFFHTFINGSELSDFVAARQEIAADLYEEMAGVDWNYKYAKQVLSMAGLAPISVREGIQDKGIIYSYASTVLYYPRNGGFLVNFEENEDRKAHNQEVFKGYVKGLQGDVDDSSSYSLFELYGEDLHWYRYFGESTYTPTLLDHVWCAIDQHKVSDLVSFDTIDYEAYNYLSCHVYPDRPTVLTTADLKNGDRDPRVLAMSYGYFNGFFYVQGSMKLQIAKYFVAIMSFLMGPEIKDALIAVIEFLEDTTVWAGLKIIILSILGLAMVFFIFSLVGKAVKYAKGQGAARDAITRFVTGVLCLGMLFAVVARPDVFNETVGKVVTIVDELFNATITSSVADNDVIGVQDSDLIGHAILWEKSVFNPWCRGQFDNLEYDELYTQYAALDSGQSAMPQDHEEIDTSDMTGKAFYDSANATGDVFAYVGGGKKIRNWAAYLMSCGTIYHIDSTLNEESAENVNVDDIRFPHWTTKTTANDPDVDADTFRVVDAQMNISPQYYANGSVNENYQHAHALKTHYDWQSNIALFNAALSLFMLPVILKKLMSFVMLFITTFKMIFYTIMEIFKENTGVAPFFDSMKKHFVDYFTSAMKLNIMLVLYMLFVDQGFIKLVLYVLCCIIILGFSWKDVKRTATDIKHTAKRIKNKI